MHTDSLECHTAIDRKTGRRAGGVVARPETVELVQRAQGGDQRSMNELSARYYPRLEQFVRSRIRSPMGGMFDVADITQQAFLHAIRCFHRFQIRNGRSLMNWLARIAQHTINELRDYLQARKRQRPEPPAEPPDDRPVAAERLMVQESMSGLMRAVGRLPLVQREILRLRYSEGWTWKQVAEAVGKPSTGAVRATHRLALRRLHQQLRRA